MNIEKIVDKDIEFLLSFPKTIMKGKYIIDYKSYGFFVKDTQNGETKSIKYNFSDIEKNNWNGIIPKLFEKKKK